jgi:5'-nucleotidase
MCAALLALGLSACSGGATRPASMEITVLGFNDLHGHLEPPGWR